jgi:hypothetical protein
MEVRPRCGCFRAGRLATSTTGREEHGRGTAVAPRIRILQFCSAIELQHELAIAGNGRRFLSNSPRRHQFRVQSMDFSSPGLSIAVAFLFGIVLVLAMLYVVLSMNQNVNGMASDILAQARDSKRDQGPATRPEDLRSILTSMSGGTCTHRSHPQSIRIDIRLPSQALIVLAIGEELRELLCRVGEHAARVMPDGARLQISASVEGPEVVVHWRDMGAVDLRPPLARFLDSGEFVGYPSARVCEQIASRHGGRIYVGAPSSKGNLGLTLRLPLHAERSTLVPSTRSGEF